MRLPRLLAVLVLAGSMSPVVVGSVPCQDPTKPPPTSQDPTAGEPPPKQSDLIESPDPTALDKLYTLLESRRTAYANRQAALAATKDPQVIADLTAELANEKRAMAQLEHSFETMLTGIDLDAFHDVDRERVDWQKELLELVKPLLRLIKTATDDPRQVEKWRAEIEFQQERARMAEQALTTLRQRTAILPPSDTGLRSELARAISRWTSARADSQNRAMLAEQFLQARLAERKTFWESVSIFMSGFFRTRGLNLVLAIGAFLAVFLGLRWLYRSAQRLGSDRQKGFRRRLLAVVYHAFVGIASTAALLMVLYATDDWVLLALAIVVLLGIAWAGKTWLPRFFEELKMMLNIGPVRERERLIYDGLPWLIDSLHVSARLVNPALTGGELRLPIRDLVGLRSRPCHDREPWFPCKEGDIVELGDGTRGRVMLQTPETVELWAGGSKTAYRTADFLGMTPKNLSERFTIAVIWGIGYAHQQIALTEVPQRMQARVQRALESLAPPGTLLAVKADFKSAAASSLDYEVTAEFKGDAAAQIGAFTRAVNRALLELCNEQGWDIPFQTMTIQMAK